MCTKSLIGKVSKYLIGRYRYLFEYEHYKWSHTIG